MCSLELWSLTAGLFAVFHFEMYLHLAVYKSLNLFECFDNQGSGFL